ncbi:hypothetical protein GCM10009812_09490 [Nocardioides marinus]
MRRVQPLLPLLLCLPVAAACSGDAQTGPTPETVTVTVDATPTGTPASEVAASSAPMTATQLMSMSGTLGCARPSDALGPASRALEALACNKFGKRERGFRVFESETKRDAEVRTWQRMARARLAPGYEPSSVLVGVEGDIYWMVTSTSVGQLRDLHRDGMGDEVLDFSGLDPEGPKTPKPKPTPSVATSFGEGTYLVGKDVAPGLYRSEGPSPNDGRYCVVYASRQPADLDSYLRGATLKGPTAVQVNEGEWVTSQYCKTFTLD